MAGSPGMLFTGFCFGLLALAVARAQWLRGAGLVIPGLGDLSPPPGIETSACPALKQILTIGPLGGPLGC